MSDYPINTTYPDSPGGQFLEGLTQAVGTFTCTVAPYYVPFLARKLPPAAQVLTYIGASIVFDGLCSNPVPDMPQLLPVPTGTNTGTGCQSGVVYTLFFEVWIQGYTGNGCPGIQQRWFKYESYVDFYGPWNGQVTYQGYQITFLYYGCRQNSDGSWTRYVQSQEQVEVYQLYFIDGYGYRRNIWTTSDPAAGAWVYSQQYIRRNTPGFDNCSNSPVEQPPYYLPPPPSGDFPPPISLVNIPVVLSPTVTINAPVQIGPIYLQPTFAPEIGIFINGEPGAIVLDPDGDPTLRSPDKPAPYFPPRPLPPPVVDNPQPIPVEPTTNQPELDPCIKENICTPFDYYLECRDCDDETKATRSGSGVEGFAGLADLVQDAAEFVVECLQSCPSLPPSRDDLIGSGTVATANQVDYVAIPTGYQYVRLEIIDYEPIYVDAYKLAGEDIEAKFGWISVALGVADSTYRNYVIAKRTIVPIPDWTVSGWYARISLKKGCDWRLYGLVP